MNAIPAPAGAMVCQQPIIGEIVTFLGLPGFELELSAIIGKAMRIAIARELAEHPPATILEQLNGETAAIGKVWHTFMERGCCNGLQG